jgi:hypothetical protein
MADREAIRAELQSTRAAYHDLLDSISDDDWKKKKTGNKAWSVKQMMAHMASAPAYTAGSVNMVRRGKGFNPPSLIADRLNVLMTRWLARKATPDSVAEQYDEGHERLIELLDGVQDDEWSKGAKFFGQHQTIEQLFQSVPDHLQEHAPDVKRGLGRG